MTGVVALLLLFLLLALAPAYSQEQPRTTCDAGDKDCAVGALRDHVVKKLDYWERALGLPVESRMGPAPPELVEFLILDNIQSGFPEKPRAAKLPDGFVRDVHAALADLPAAVKRSVAARLAGIYFVEDLGGTGYTDEIYDARSHPVAGFVVLDMAVLNRRTANEWATWKENTPFKPEAGFELTARIEGPRGNHRRNAIQYILLHELGHVFSIGERIHPSWNAAPKEVVAAEYPYFQVSWTVSQADNRYLTRFDDTFPRRKDVVYYLQPKLPAGEMVAVYESLERTNFATLYAVTNPADDFAEAFASYVHTVLMKKPFEIRIRKDGRIARIYRSCWTEPRCAEKRAILESLLGR